MTRRHLLALGLGTAASGVATTASARRARPPETPRTLEAAVAAFETLISPEAMAHIAAVPPARRIEYERGFNQLRQMRWLDGWPAAEGRVGKAVRADCQALGFPETELTAYLITMIARRHGAPPVDLSAGLAPFREANRIEREAQERRDAACRAGKTCIRLGMVEILDQLYFTRGSAELRAGQADLVQAIAQMIAGMDRFIEVEVQAHASPGEAHGDELAHARARVVVDALVRAGAPARKLTAHGLSARFGNLAPTDAAGPDRERRAEVIGLRQERPLS